MSAVPVTKRPKIGPTKRRKHRVTQRRMTAAAAPSIRVHTRPKTRVNLGSIVSARAVSFAIIAGLVFMGSSLTGQVMVEKARREGLRAAERAREARKSEAILRQQVDHLQSLSAVENWATAHGFVAPDGLAQPSSTGVSNGTATH